MIYTLTPNPALDLEYRVDDIRLGKIHRAEAVSADWGGKGFNVSRVLQVLGEESTAVGFAAGFTGQRLLKGLSESGIRTELIWLAGETRTNISLVGKTDGAYLKVNEPGPTAKLEDVDRLMHRINELSRPGDLWVLSGSLPRGISVDFFARVIRIVKQKGSRVILDTSGAALVEGCGADPDLVKPNAEEASELTAMDITSVAGAVNALARIARLGPERVVISLGELGAVAGANGIGYYTRPLPVQIANPVGAGDALVAGLAAGWVRGWPMKEMLRLGIACGASAAAQTGTGIGSRAEIEKLASAVTVEECILTD
jgi:1-phosphofructokinase family hexose kinase